MRKRILFTVLCVFVFTCAYAETIVLRTGARVKGSIVFQNEEVVIIRDPETGARFQYPRAEVTEILTVEAEEPEQVAEEPEEAIRTAKKVSIALELAGGAAVNPGNGIGGAMSADLLVGSHHIGDKHLFIGGGLGYHGLFIGDEKFNFLPIQVALRMPFMETKHAPIFGVAIGYGIALSKAYKGGVYAAVDLGYRCQLNPKTALALTAFTQFQQATLDNTEVIEDARFINFSGRNFVVPGIKLTLFF